jgi:hypothetical protein
MKSTRFVSLMVSLQLVAGTLVVAQTADRTDSKRALSLRCVVNGRTVRSPGIAVTVSAPFRYGGGQRFLLGDVADAEQHLFVVSGESGDVKELLWLQFEEYLPQVPGTYNYEGDGRALRNGLTFFTNVRRYTTPPQSGSDREHAFELLRNTGYHVESLTTRVRLVHLPNSAQRSEVMIIYAIPANEKAELTTEQSQAIIKQALQRVSVSRR